MCSFTGADDYRIGDGLTIVSMWSISLLMEDPRDSLIIAFLAVVVADKAFMVAISNANVNDAKTIMIALTLNSADGNAKGADFTAKSGKDNGKAVFAAGDGNPIMNAGFARIRSSDNAENTDVDGVSVLVFLSTNGEDAKTVDAVFNVDVNLNGEDNDANVIGVISKAISDTETICIDTILADSDCFVNGAVVLGEFFAGMDANGSCSYTCTCSCSCSCSCTCPSSCSCMFLCACMCSCTCTCYCSCTFFFCVSTFFSCVSTFCSCACTFFFCASTFCSCACTFFFCAYTFFFCASTFCSCTCAFFFCACTFCTCASTFCSCACTFFFCACTFGSCASMFCSCACTFFFCACTFCSYTSTFCSYACTFFFCACSFCSCACTFFFCAYTFCLCFSCMCDCFSFTCDCVLYFEDANTNVNYGDGVGNVIVGKRDPDFGAAKGNVANCNAAHGNVAYSNVAHGNVANGDVAYGNINANVDAHVCEGNTNAGVNANCNVTYFNAKDDNVANCNDTVTDARLFILAVVLLVMFVVYNDDGDSEIKNAITK